MREIGRYPQEYKKSESSYTEVSVERTFCLIKNAMSARIYVSLVGQVSCTEQSNKIDEGRFIFPLQATYVRTHTKPFDTSGIPIVGVLLYY